MNFTMNIMFDLVAAINKIRSGFMKNDYKIVGDEIHIYLYNKDGEKYTCLVDKDEFDKLNNFNYKWHLLWAECTKSYYAKATEYKGIINGKASYRTVLLHRFVTDCPSDMTVDHLNYNTLDNRKSNLKIVTLDDNNKNRQNKANRNSTTGVRNVCYSKSYGKYIVQFQINGKNTLMGMFNTLQDAKEYADKNRSKYYTNVS